VTAQRDKVTWIGRGSTLWEGGDQDPNLAIKTMIVVG